MESQCWCGFVKDVDPYFEIWLAGYLVVIYLYHGKSFCVIPQEKSLEYEGECYFRGKWWIGILLTQNLFRNDKWVNQGPWNSHYIL